MNEPSPPVDDRIIECVDVRKHFGDVVVLDGVTFAVSRGEFLALSGGSGTGKSTLLHLLAALDRPTSGSIRVNGHDLGSLRTPNRYRRLEVGLVFQLHNLLPRLTASENVELAMFGTHRSAAERRTRARELLGELGIGDLRDRTPTRLSGGERQRVAIARALANEPMILLADEPTGNLDRASTEGVLGLLERMRTSGRLTIVMVTHDDAVAARADREIALDAGHVIDLDRA